MMKRETLKAAADRRKPIVKLAKVIMIMVFPTLLTLGCVTTSQMVLMPDPEGTVGALDVSTLRGKQTLHEAWQSTEATSMKRVPAGRITLEEGAVKKMFDEALSVQPVRQQPAPPAAEQPAAVLPAAKPPEPVLPAARPPEPIRPEPVPTEVVRQQAAPQEAAQPIPVSSVNFIVHFRTNSAALSPKARAQLKKARQAAERLKPAAIVAHGHTDTVGPSGYNRRLSLRRANAVAKFLAARGIDRRIIQVTPHGEDNLLVPTPDGVPNRKNRRVEIVVR